MTRGSVTTWVEDTRTFTQYKRAFRLSVSSGAPTRYHLNYLFRTKGMSGTSVLRMAEGTARKLGGTTLRLQDAASIGCDPAKKSTYDLGFRSLLRHGMTWYEARGYEPLGKHATRWRSDVAASVRAYVSIRVSVVRDAVRSQVLALQVPGVEWAYTSWDLFTTVPDTRGTTVRPVRRSLLNMRRRLCGLLDGAPQRSRLGHWLSSLSCCDYAMFMLTMYGSGSQRAVAVVGGVRTPTLEQFRLANGMRTHSHRIDWIKCLT